MTRKQRKPLAGQKGPQVVAAAPKPAKKPTKGQRQIHEENHKAMIFYATMAFLTSVLAFSLHLLHPKQAPWIGWAMSASVQAAALWMMWWMMGAVMSKKGRVTDAGTDLNDPSGFAEICKDFVILSSLAQLAGLWTPQVYWILLVVPICLLYKAIAFLRLFM